MRPEAAMGQHAMVANGQAEGSERVHRCQKCQVGPVNDLLPKQRDCQNSSEERNDHNYKNKRFCVAQRFHKISSSVVVTSTTRTRINESNCSGLVRVSPVPTLQETALRNFSKQEFPWSYNTRRGSVSLLTGRYLPKFLVYEFSQVQLWQCEYTSKTFYDT